MKNLLTLLLLLSFAACKDAAVQEELIALKTELSTLKAEMASTAEQNAAQPGLVHSVFFWLKEDLSDTDRTAFLASCRALTKISTIKNCHIGPPAATEEPGIVDNSYSYAVIVHFDDLAGENAYQIDPIHLKFIEDHKDKWTKVVVYDNIVLK